MVQFIASRGSVRVAVLGAGRIGSVLAWGFRNCGFSVVATARSEERLRAVSSLGVETTRDNGGLLGALML